MRTEVGARSEPVRFQVRSLANQAVILTVTVRTNGNGAIVERPNVGKQRMTNGSLSRSTSQDPQRWQQLVDVAPCAMAVVGPAASLIAINEQALELLGHNGQSPLQFSLGNDWHLESPSQSELSVALGLFGQPARVSQTICIVHVGGSRRRLSFSSRRVIDGTGGPIWTVCINDATASRSDGQNHDATVISLDRGRYDASAWRRALDAVALIAVLDRQGRFVEANKRFCELSGFPPEELVGRHLSFLHSPATAQHVIAGLVGALEGGRTWRGTLCEVTKCGQAYWADTSIVPMRGPSGQVEKFLAVRTDVSERQRVETLLTEAIETVPDGFVIYDENDKLAIYNSAYRRMYPLTAPVLKSGTTFTEVLRYGLDRGQYPQAGETPEERQNWLVRRLQLHAEGNSEFHQPLRDGRHLLVRERRTASGLSVGFRSDVTDLVRQQELLNTIIDHFPGGISYVDGELIVRHRNQQFMDILDLPETLFSRGETSLRDVIFYNAERGEYGPGDPAKITAERMRLATLDTAHQYERTRPNGRVISVQRVPVRGGGFVTSYIDVTGQKALHDELVRTSRNASEKAQQLSLTLEHMAQGLVMFDVNGRLSSFNQRYLQLFELDAEKVQIGMHALDLLQIRGETGTFAGDPLDRLAEVKQSLATGFNFRATLKTRAGRLIQSVTAPIPGGGWVSTHEDITERMEALERIQHAAQHDALTGLHNRDALKGHINDALLAGGPFSVMMLDLDRFKAVNDTYGHAIGDEVLRQAADRMRSCVRGQDIVARLGGDEFAILFRGASNQNAASIALAHRLLERVSLPYIAEGRQLVIGASIGIALAPDHGGSTDELMRNADAALYKVKTSGRNALRVYDRELDAVVQARRVMEADLRCALSRDEFKLFYQPVVDLQSGEVTGVEALLRWQHPQHGIISPASFIPLLEETGLINAVGDWVLERACCDAASMPPRMRTAVNVSPVQFRNRSMYAIIEPMLHRWDLDPRRLELEVTESVLIDRDEELLDDLQRLRRMGVHIVLDDFGTGYSSLSYIRNFPFDKLKIDKGFVDDLGHGAEANAVIGAVVSLTKSLAIASTAEGIETADQVRLLRAAGCLSGQGYLFGKPAPLAEISFKRRQLDFPIGGRYHRRA